MYAWLHDSQLPDASPWMRHFRQKVAQARATHRVRLNQMEISPIRVTKIRRVRQPDGTVVETTEITETSPKPADINRHLRREFPEEYAPTRLRSKGTTTHGTPLAGPRDAGETNVDARRGNGASVAKELPRTTGASGARAADARPRGQRGESPAPAPSPPVRRARITPLTPVPSTEPSPEARDRARRAAQERILETIRKEHARLRPGQCLVDADASATPEMLEFISDRGACPVCGKRYRHPRAGWPPLKMWAE